MLNEFFYFIIILLFIIIIDRCEQISSHRTPAQQTFKWYKYKYKYLYFHLNMIDLFVMDKSDYDFILSQHGNPNRKQQIAN